MIEQAASMGNSEQGVAFERRRTRTGESVVDPTETSLERVSDSAIDMANIDTGGGARGEFADDDEELCRKLHEWESLLRH